MSRLIIAPWETEERASPRDFLFGGMTHALQVESPDEAPARGEDGADRGRESAGAPRFLERHGEDLRLARELGMNAFRFSVSWSRVMPGGRGRPRREAFDAYLRVAERATSLGLRTTCALWHGDRPFGRQPAWLEADAAERFADLAEQAGLRLGHLVSFLTLHEPGSQLLPDAASPASSAGPVAEAAGRAARAHALAREALRATCGAEIGLGVEIVTPVSRGRTPADGAAARFLEAARTRSWLHLACGVSGRLLGALDAAGADTPERARLLGAIDAAAGPRCDFLFVRVARPRAVAFDPSAAFGIATRARDLELASWKALSAAVRDLAADAPELPALFLASRHPAADGAAEQPDLRGRVEDLPRVRAIEADVESWRQALAAGVPLRGGFTDLLDGFDPDAGAFARSGLVHVDRETGQRIVKASGEAFRRTVEAW